MSALMEVKNLHLYFRTLRGIVRAVDDVTFTVDQGESLAIIGESGCGKSSLARAILRFLPRNVATYKGSVVIDGVDVMNLSDSEFDERIRWTKISYVSQAAMNSLNPVVRVIDHLIEPLVLHKGVSKREATEAARSIVSLVGLPEEFLWRYPFELSGGMKQRVVISLALITRPNIVILDEPTSALDVMTQANILSMLKDLKSKTGASFIFITHDIGISSEIADRVAVMYAGEIVELNRAETVYIEPLHPYSKALLSSVPRLHENKAPTFVPGVPPSLINPPPGCRFRPRCPFVMPVCGERPPLTKLDRNSYVRCWLYAGK
ncbi:MAG: ABC transporter ATP-binding protein [Zestosphaera sp.]